MGQRKNSESPWGIEPQTFRFCTLMLYHWATETPWWARSIMKFLWHASCILLGSAMLMAYCLKIEIREMVSFGLRKEIEKDFFCLVTSVGQRKNSESPWGIEPQTFRFHALMLYHWTTETPWWARSNIKFIWHTSYILLGSAMLMA